MRRTRTPRRPRRLTALILGLGLLLPVIAGSDDTDLFIGGAVSPNVLFILDNSASMRHVVWHPDFDKSGSIPSCGISGTFWTPDWRSITSDTVFTANSSCGSRSFTAFVDPDLSGDTWWDVDYLNWILSLDPAVPADAQILADIASTNNGARSSCLAPNQTYAKYRRSRVTATKEIIRTVICEVNQQGSVRFGIAEFRVRPISIFGSNDPNGGFVSVPIDDWSASQDAALDAAITALDGETWTPLAETLFQIYTYFMPRVSADMPDGADNDPFPMYEYNTSTSGTGGDYDPGNEPPDPVQYACQKNFVVLITDGISTRDDFDSETPTNTATGFGSPPPDIGDYNNDGETETGLASEGTLWLDDIAKYMNENDFRPDLPDTDGPQVIEVYTVGFATDATANALLQKTANVGCTGTNCFFTSSNAEQLASDLVTVVGDIVEKSQGFTSATVPATRTAAGGDFYTSLFFPTAASPFWEGHVMNWTIDSVGRILDSANPPQCALDDQSGGACLSGPFLTSAVPHWDAADVMPAPASRNIWTSNLVASVPTAQTFVSSRTTNATELGVTYPPATPYTNSGAVDAEGLADEIIEFMRGCTFGSGVTTTCVERVRQNGLPKTLGDVFHSNPVVVGPPSSVVYEASYAAFASTWASRQRRLIAGANDGLVHAFDAGDPNVASDHGSGVEQWAFMPWYVRQNIKNLPIDSGSSRTFYGVDGSPAVADIWDYQLVNGGGGATTLPGAKASDGSEWRTVLVGGLRQGGPQYFALDVTDPSETDMTNMYLWEWPREDGSTIAVQAAHIPFIGETWSPPVITKVKVTVPGDLSGGVYERWVAIFGGGYHPESDPNNVAYNDTGTASANGWPGRAVVMLDVATGQVLASHVYGPSAGNSGWTRGDMKYAFAAQPAVLDLDFDGYADVVYFGDLGGQLWKWVINSAGVDTINPTETVSKLQSNWSFGRVFDASTACIGGVDVTDGPSACASNGGAMYYKSFFFPPTATYVGSNLWLALGTGERANPTFLDPDTSETADNNRFYSLKDPSPYSIPLDVSSNPDPVVEADLDDLTTTEGCASLSSGDGFYFMARDNEKFVTNSEIINYRVFAGSFTPTSGGTCDTGGEADLYIFRINCGEGFFPSETGADQRRVHLGDGVPTDPRLSLGEENRLYVVTSENEVFNPPLPPLPSVGPGLLYWRELR